MAKETAEEKLKKLLQKSGAPVAATAVAKAPEKKKFAISFSMALVNKVLLIAIVGCVAVLLLQMREGMQLINAPVDLSEDQKTMAMADMALPSAKNISVYIDKINARNIFKPFDAQPAKGAEVKNSVVTKLSKYKLVGVAWLDLPETASVMIEDTATKQTYFLKQGEQIEGVTVKTIYTDRAVLGDENEETTIKL